MARITSAIGLVALLAAGVSACASASASSKGSEPALAIPAPPPHVVPITPEPIVEPVGEIPGGTSSTPSTNPPARQGRGTRDANARPAASDAKPETKPGAGDTPATQPEVTPAPVAPPPAGPPPQLRTAESSGTEGTVRATIERARQMLRTVDYRLQSTERRKAYDDAKKFADQADEALKQGNVVFAQGVAAKAETLAKELAGR